MDPFSPNHYRAPVDTDRKILSVSELNKRVKSLLEIHLPLIWLEGEISNFSCPRSGHWYFTLKDDSAQVRAAMFKGRNQLVRFRPKEGDQVLIRGRVSLYEGRGDFQLIAEHMESAGAGALQRKFEELKAKLQAEGLFDTAHKKPFVEYPKKVAVVTSPTGAAIRDVLSVLERRCPGLEVTIVPSAVQGENAPAELINGLLMADRSEMFGTIIICRGGGSIEDLWAFNDENLARTIHQLKTPVISAVGHEVDYTISDLVADARGATPSAAAELISPDTEEMLSRLEAYKDDLESLITQLLQKHQARLDLNRAQLKHPRDKLFAWEQQLDHLEMRIANALQNSLNTSDQKLQTLQQKVSALAPQHKIHQLQQKTGNSGDRLTFAMQQSLNRLHQKLANAAESLNIVSPLATLQRGYAIVKDEEDNIVRDKATLKPGDNINIAVAKGVFSAQVTATDF